MQRSAISAGIWAVLLIVGSLLQWTTITTRVSDVPVSTAVTAWTGGSIFGLPIWVPVVLGLVACGAVLLNERRLVWAAAIASLLVLGAIAFVLSMSSAGRAGIGVWVCILALIGLLSTSPPKPQALPRR